jgi:hypothetical protein
LGGSTVVDLVLSSPWDSGMGLIRLRQYDFLGVPFLLFRWGKPRDWLRRLGWKGTRMVRAKKGKKKTNMIR